METTMLMSAFQHPMLDSSVAYVVKLYNSYITISIITVIVIYLCYSKHINHFTGGIFTYHILSFFHYFWQGILMVNPQMTT